MKEAEIEESKMMEVFIQIPRLLTNMWSWLVLMSETETRPLQNGLSVGLEDYVTSEY